MTVKTYRHCLVFASTDPTLSIRIIHVQRKRKRDESIPSGSRRRLRCVDRWLSGHATFRADLPWCRGGRIHRWHRRIRREVRSGETCIQHLKSKAETRSIFASILSWWFLGGFFCWNKNRARNLKKTLMVGQNGSVQQVEIVFLIYEII